MTGEREKLRRIAKCWRGSAPTGQETHGAQFNADCEDCLVNLELLEGGYAAGLERAAQIAENPYNQVISRWDRPLTVSKTLARAIRAEAKPK